MSSIELRTEIPGPRSRALVERRHAATPSGWAHSTPVAVESAEGALVRDVDGNTLVDLAGGIGMLNLGHNHPDVVAAIHAQTDRLLHACALVATMEPFVELCELLCECAPGDFPKKAHVANTGAEAVENAMKFARAHTGRQALVTFDGAYHGRTLLAATLTSKYDLFKRGFGPFAPEVYRFPFPDLYRRPAGMTEEEAIDDCLRRVREGFVSRVAPSAVAAVIVEPLQGEGGFHPAPPAFLQGLRALCDEHGMLLVADEVQAGMGRTGRLWSIEHAGVIPDLIVTAKSLGAGMPLAAVVGRADVLDSIHPGGVGGTFGGSPVACAAGSVALRAIREPAFLERGVEVGERLRARLEDWRARFPLVGDARGLGAMRAIELVRDPRTREPAPEETVAVVRSAIARGVLLIRAGLFSNCIRFLPPLNITDGQLDDGLDAVEAALAEHTGG